MVHKKGHQFLAQFSIPFHMVWSVLLRVVAQKTTLWLVEIFWQPIRSFYSMVFEATTRNKMKHIMWKSMKNCARKWCLFSCTILFEVTWASGLPACLAGQSEQWTKFCSTNFRIYLLECPFFLCRGNERGSSPKCSTTKGCPGLRRGELPWQTVRRILPKLGLWGTGETATTLYSLSSNFRRHRSPIYDDIQFIEQRFWPCSPRRFHWNHAMGLYV